MKPLFDLLPLLIFFAAFKFYDIYLATVAAIAASGAQVGVLWLRHRRFETMPLVTLAVLAVFGGLTIALKDDAFIKWKPSIVSWVFTAGILATVVFTKRSALQAVMGRALALPPAAWRRLDVAWAAFFFLLGALNVYVAFYYDAAADAHSRTATWVSFKVFVIPALSLVFAVGQMFWLRRHILPTEEAK